MGRWRPKSFQYDGCKDMHCHNCGRYLEFDSRLTDKKSVFKKCSDCKAITPIHPPRRIVLGSKRYIAFGDYLPDRNPLECTLTADYTES